MSARRAFTGIAEGVIENPWSLLGQPIVLAMCEHRPGSHSGSL